MLKKPTISICKTENKPKTINTSISINKSSSKACPKDNTTELWHFCTDKQFNTTNQYPLFLDQKPTQILSNDITIVYFFATYSYFINLIPQFTLLFIQTYYKVITNAIDPWSNTHWKPSDQRNSFQSKVIKVFSQATSNQWKTFVQLSNITHHGPLLQHPRTCSFRKLTPCW